MTDLLEKENLHISARQTWYWLALSVALTFLFLFPVLNSDWVNWDDPVYVTQNSAIHDFSASGIASLFHPNNRVLDTYTPLTLVSLAIDYKLAQNNAGWFHATNLLLHLINVSLVFLLFWRLTKKPLVAFLIATLFGLHPLHVESVAWISERKDVLFAFFFLASCIQFLAHLRAKKSSTKNYWISLILAGLAMLAKPEAVTLPLVLILINYWENSRFNLSQIIPIAPFFLLSLITGIGALYFMDSDVLAYSWLERILMSGHALWIYLIKAVIPFNITHDMGQPAPGMLPIFYYLTSSLSVILLGTFLWLGRKNKVLVFGILFFFANIIFSLHLIKVNSGAYYDRFTYLPYLGLFFIAAMMLENMTSKWQKGQLKFSLIALPVILLFGMISYERSQVWQNDETLWTDIITSNPDHKLAWCKRARYLNAEGRLEEALFDQNECLRLNPNMSDGLNNRGNIYLGLGNVDAALKDYTSAIKAAPKHSLPYSSRGVLLMQLGDNQNGMSDLKKAVELSPESSTLRLNLGLAYELENDVALAQKEYSLAIELNPTDHLAWKYRGSLALANGDVNSALRDLEHAVELRPDFGDAWYRLSIANHKLGNKKDALIQLDKAVENGVEDDIEYRALLERIEL